MEAGYDFITEPQSVSVKRKSGVETCRNLMFDKRVHRGNVFRNRIESAISSNQNVTEPRPKKPQKKAVPRPRTPPAVDGRMHIDLQTECFLETLMDRPIEKDVEIQTDPTLSAPISIPFVPTPSGIDVCTQIEDGELFDFDLEVEPILQVLIGKALELGMLEVCEETELYELGKSQEIFSHMRHVELVELERLEAEAKRKFIEKQKRVEQEEKRLRHQIELEEKVAARGYATQYLACLHAQVFDSLVESGYFGDSGYKELKDGFVMSVLEKACVRVGDRAMASNLIDSMLCTLFKST